MDHISKWIRLQRTEIKRRTKSRTTPTQQQNNDEAKARLERVQRIFSEIDSGLVAQAALQCKAYPRSLLNFEQRILALQSAKSDHSQELDQQFEELHRIYARLDEPDGMEGVSTRILTPSLEHQISEHESTGRWTSAQSCWEVLIREKPNDLDRHMGLLRCLRNLGHYGKRDSLLASNLALAGVLTDFNPSRCMQILSGPTSAVFSANSPSGRRCWGATRSRALGW